MDRFSLLVSVEAADSDVLLMPKGIRYVTVFKLL
jgi:hypothetical protein